MRQRVKWLQVPGITWNLQPATYHLEPATFLLLCILLLSGCWGSTATVAQTAVGSNADAIEHFINTAPDAVSHVESAAGAALPTPLAPGDQGISMPEVDPTQLDGDIYVSGSPSLGELTQQLFKQFVADGYPGALHVEIGGTSIGYEDFCGVNPDRPLADLAGGTRPMVQEELALCMGRGRMPLAFKVGLATYVIVVHPTNDFVTDVSVAQLAELFTAKRWSDVNPAWPQRKITRIIIVPSNHTFTFFAEVVFAGDQQQLQNASNLVFTQDEIENVELVQDNPDAISFITYSTYRRYRNNLRLVQLEGKLPTETMIQREEWPFVAPLIFYTTADLLQTKPQLKGFLAFYLTHLQEEISDLGLFALPSATLDRARLNLLIGTGNTAWLDDLRETQANTQTVER